MCLEQSQSVAADVIRAFHRDEIYLFLGAAITTVGAVSTSFFLLRRRKDLLLLWFGLFALMYGSRLWWNYSLLGIDESLTELQLRTAFNLLIPVPAFFFLNSFLPGRVGKIVAYIASPMFLLLAVAAVAGGPLRLLYNVNNTIVIVCLFLLLVSQFSLGAPSRDVVLVRRGLLVFIAVALFDNIADFFGTHLNLEPFGFLLFLSCLGLVAARRALADEQQLSVVRKELEIAQRIQLSLLPAAFPDSTRFKVAARYLPMTSVAGDLYDFVLATDSAAGLLIADVSGHGVPAALIASMVKLAANTQRGCADRPADLLHGMNAALCGNTQSQFVTAAYVYLDAERKEMRYAAAAHPPMLVLRAGEVLSIEENGLMLAAFGFAKYATATHSLLAGDRILLYTDGLLEAANKSEEEFGAERLQTLLRNTEAVAPVAAADQIVTAIQNWQAVQNDDLTVLICDFMG